MWLTTAYFMQTRICHMHILVLWFTLSWSFSSAYCLLTLVWLWCQISSDNMEMFWAGSDPLVLYPGHRAVGGSCFTESSSIADMLHAKFWFDRTQRQFHLRLPFQITFEFQIPWKSDALFLLSKSCVKWSSIVFFFSSSCTHNMKLRPQLAGKNQLTFDK